MAAQPWQDPTRRREGHRMILYHGSNVEVRLPRILTTNRSLDFGAGFYTTSSPQPSGSDGPSFKHGVGEAAELQRGEVP